MSLINDALRRAKQVQEQAPAPPPPPPLNPVDPAPHLMHGLGVLVPVSLTAVALLGLFLLWQVYQRNNSNRTVQPGTAPLAQTAVAAGSEATATQSTRSAPPVVFSPNLASVNAPAPESTRPAAAPGPAAAPNSDGAAPGAAGVSVITNAVISPAGTNTTISAQPEPPKPPPLTLQGIVFNPRRPSVVINGKTLFLGDRIGQFRVAAIHADSTVLIGAGRTNLLSLEQ
jgi:hypothetical protein